MAKEGNITRSKIPKILEWNKYIFFGYRMAVVYHWGKVKVKCLFIVFRRVWAQSAMQLTAACFELTSDMRCPASRESTKN